MDLEKLRKLAENATPGEWFYNGYSGIFIQPVPDPKDGLTFDEWSDQIEEGHTAERYGACPECGTDRPDGCKYAAEWYRRDTGLVAFVPALYGDTAVGQHVSDALYIEALHPAVVLELLDRLEAAERALQERGE